MCVVGIIAGFGALLITAKTIAQFLTTPELVTDYENPEGYTVRSGVVESFVGEAQLHLHIKCIYLPILHQCVVCMYVIVVEIRGVCSVADPGWCLGCLGTTQEQRRVGGACWVNTSLASQTFSPRESG